MDGDGAAAVMEAPVETQATEASTIPESTGSTTGSTKETKPAQTDPAKPAEKVDNRQNPDALRKALKWLRENGQEHSKAAQDLERSLGELKSWKTVAPTVKEAREIKAAFDAVGGREKLAEMQQYTTKMREVDSLIEAGDERVLPMILESAEAKSGVAKLLPGLMRELIKTHSAEVSRAIQPHVGGYLESQGFSEVLNAMAGAFKSNEPAKANQLLGQLIAWWNKGPGSQSEEVEKPAGEQAWEKDKQKFLQEAYAAKVKATADAHLDQATIQIDKELAPYLKTYGIPPETAELIRADVWNRIGKERDADPIFTVRINDLINDRSRKVDPQALAFLNAQVDQRVKEAVRKEIGLRYGFIKNGTQKPAEKTSVTAPPAVSAVTIDHDMTVRKLGRDGAQDSILQGKAFNSVGKPIKKVGRLWQLA
jgi:hypothetical protein